jgi:hypothetical protein
MGFDKTPRDRQQEAYERLRRVFLDATDDLPDDVDDGIAAMFAHPEDVIALLGGELQGKSWPEEEFSFYRFPRVEEAS